MGDVVKNLLKQTGMTQAAAADFLGVSSRTVRRWVGGDEVPRAVILLLSLMIRYDLKRYEIEYLVQL